MSDKVKSTDTPPIQSLQTNLLPIKIWNPRFDRRVRGGEAQNQSLIDKSLASANKSNRIAPEGLVDLLLKSRGIDDKLVIEAILNPKLKDLASPFEMLGIQASVERLLKAYQTNEKICIYGDFDLDGTCGLALLYKGFKGLGFKNVIPFQPSRLKEGYGFHDWVVQELYLQGVTLIVTVDVGVTAFLACEKAKELKVDVIITDHHLPVEKNPDCYCMVNPNQKGCQSGLGYLSGAGVGFYLLRGLKRYFLEHNVDRAADFQLNEVLDFLVIATITDMVPMLGDNRALVRAGLTQLQKTVHPGLKALLEVTQLSSKVLTSSDIGIRLAPKLNALSRLELGLRPIDILLEQDPLVARDLILKVTEQNNLRIELQSEGEKKARILIQDVGNQPFIFVYDREFHRGVIGLIASKLSKDLGVPCFVGSIDDAGKITASARLPAGYPVGLVEALQSASSFLHRFGGHFAAAGFELSIDNITNFKNSLEMFYLSALKKGYQTNINYDFDLYLEEITLEHFLFLEKAEPFGQGFEPPVFGLNRIKLNRVKELKGGHYKFFVTQDTGRDMAKKELELLGFSLDQDSLKIIKSGDFFDLLVELQKNEFNGRTSIQGKIRDVRHSK